MALNLTQLVTDARRQLDEFTLSGELAITDTDMEDLASSNFVDQDIKDELLRAARWVTSRTKANFHPQLITSSLTVPAKSLRLLGSRVRYNGIVALRRTFRGHLHLESTGSGRPASNTAPVYVFEDREFHIYTSTTDPAGATGDWIIWPNSVTLLEDIFRRAVVARAVGVLFMTLRLMPNANTSFQRANAEIQRYLIRQPEDSGPTS